jgi:hypothetical protein
MNTLAFEAKALAILASLAIAFLVQHVSPIAHGLDTAGHIFR